MATETEPVAPTRGPGKKRDIGEETVDRIARRHRLRFHVPIRQPLVIISQVQRSGGTLMTQLLDGHPQLHVLPIEPHLARPKWHWPRYDLSEPPGRLFRRFGRRSILQAAVDGFAKLGEPVRSSGVGERYVLPFIFMPKLHGRLFVLCLEEAGTPTQRAVVEAYFTSFFNAWIDYQALYGPEDAVRHVVAFMPRLVGTEGQYDAFAEDYPDGKVIVPLRDPVSWYASASRHSEAYQDVGEAIALWNELNRRTLALAKANPDRFLVVAFEAVVKETERTMRRVAEFLGITYRPSMLVPTFNRIPTVSNSSFEAHAGIDAGAAKRRDLLEAPLREAIETGTGEVYGALRALAYR